MGVRKNPSSEGLVVDVGLGFEFLEPRLTLSTVACPRVYVRNVWRLRNRGLIMSQCLGFQESRSKVRPLAFWANT